LRQIFYLYPSRECPFLSKKALERFALMIMGRLQGLGNVVRNK
jgi:hypothetical protein